MRMHAFRMPIAGFLIVLSLTIVAIAQPPSQEPANKPIKVKGEPNNAHKRWINEDVGPIVTEAEREAFRRLTTNEERENFIATFWRLRDPNPDTEENEYREEYYERIAYANQNFTSGIPGWKTDRGRIYIRWGKPDSIESRPSGGAYDRPSYEGGGSTTVYPFETWFYRHLEGVGDGIEVEFVDRTGTGEYRIARSPDEKDALANVPGAGPRTDRLTSTNASYQRVQDGIFERMYTLSRMELAPAVKGTPDWVVFDESAKLLNENPLDVEHQIDFFRLSDDKVMVAFTVQADNRELKFEQAGGIETAKLNIFGRITAVSGKRTGTFEDAVTTTALRSDLASLKERKSIYQKVIVLSPGVYKIDLAVRDVATGNQGTVRQGFAVPKYDEQKLSTSTLVLASKLHSTSEADAGARFVIGGAKVVPNLSGVYKQGQDVGIYLQVYNAGTDQTTLRPAVDVEYILTSGGKEVLRQTEDWSGLSDAGQRLTLARMIGTGGLSPGDYEVKVLIRDRVNTQVIENKSKFSITK